MDAYDLAVIGGGPAGYSAALRGAELGARVVLIEAEKPGGACVHHACIPTNIMLGAALTHLEARELGVMGVFDVGDQFNFARAAARKDALVKKLADGIQAALRMRKVQVIGGRASFKDPHVLSVDGGEDIRAEAVVIATGTRWEPLAVPGANADRVLTVDAVQALHQAPAAALVLGGGPADTAFALEYATLLALSGSTVALATPYERLLPALDADLAAVAKGSLVDLGISVFEQATVEGVEGTHARLAVAGQTESVPADVIVAADPRVPFFASLSLEHVGVRTEGAIVVDRSCRTNVPHIYAAGDVTGGSMLTNAATHMGQVAAANACGGSEVTRLARVPHLLHTLPEIAWIGLTEEQARQQGYEVTVGAFDLSFNARAVALGAREGIVKVVADRTAGEVLGVHICGPGAGELLAVATAVIQAETSLADLASLVAWHPSLTEGLVEAARRAL
jgi:dihydrolipoamide dehydrogenase